MWPGPPAARPTMVGPRSEENFWVLEALSNEKTRFCDQMLSRHTLHSNNFISNTCMCTVQICTKANIHVNRVKSLPATCAMLSVKLKICQPKSFGQGCGGNGGTCRRAEERGCSGGGSSASMVKLTLRSSDELTTKPPAMRGFRNRSFRPCPVLHPFIRHRDNYDGSRDGRRLLVAVVCIAPIDLSRLATDLDMAASRNGQLLTLVGLGEHQLGLPLLHGEPARIGGVAIKVAPKNADAVLAGVV